MSASSPEFPAVCLEQGMPCTSCTETSARELARACPGLSGKMITQLFVQIHVHSACSRMHAHFASAYAEAAGVPLRKPAASVRPLAIAATA